MINVLDNIHSQIFVAFRKLKKCREIIFSNCKIIFVKYCKRVQKGQTWLIKNLFKFHLSKSKYSSKSMEYKLRLSKQTSIEFMIDLCDTVYVFVGCSSISVRFKTQTFIIQAAYWRTKSEGIFEDCLRVYHSIVIC